MKKTMETLMARWGTDMTIVSGEEETTVRGFFRAVNYNSTEQKGGECEMSVKVVVREGETIDDAMRRFKRGVNKSGILLECRKREAYLKPGLARAMKSKMARRKKF